MRSRRSDPIVHTDHLHDDFRLRIQTLDLLQACPIWQEEVQRNNRWFRPIHELCRRCSNRVMIVGAPRSPRSIPAGEVDLQLSWQLMSLWQCRTALYWAVIEPVAQLTLEESCFAGLEEMRHAYCATLLLCQHEIRGD